MTGTDRFDDVARRLAEEPTTWTTNDYQVSLVAIKRFVIARFRLPESEADDVASEVMLKFFQLHADGRIDPVKNPGSYLLRAAQWTALDHMKREARVSNRELSFDPRELPDSDQDDNIARALDASATAELVRAALARSRVDGDLTTYSVVVALLDAVEIGGSRPSNRKVAKSLGISHTAVADAITRFKAYLSDEVAS